MATKMPVQEVATETLDWWIASDQLSKGGRKILGPFATRDLALDVRTYVEKVHRTDQYWVDSEPRP